MNELRPANLLETLKRIAEDGCEVYSPRDDLQRCIEKYTDPEMMCPPCRATLAIIGYTEEGKPRWPTHSVCGAVLHYDPKAHCPMCRVVVPREEILWPAEWEKAAPSQLKEVQQEPSKPILDSVAHLLSVEELNHLAKKKGFRLIALRRQGEPVKRLTKPPHKK